MPVSQPPRAYGAIVRRVGFRGRLFLILLFFALVPSIVLTAAWAASWWVLPLTSTATAWDSAAATGARALSVARSRKLSPRDSAAVDQHEQALTLSQTQSRRAAFVFERAAPFGAALSLIAFALLLVVASRVAGHLSRSLSRPLQELVGWTERIAHAEPLP